jgi:DHA1 family tetracycline resistance protein-like MFS transporter
MRRPPALPFLLVTVFIDLLGLGLVVPIAPQLITGLGGHRGSSAILFGLLVASYGLLQFAVSPLLGSLSDRYGRRPVLLASLTFLGLDYLAFAVTPSLWLLLLSRALAGATAGTYTVVNAYIADVTPPGDRARAYGLVGAMFSLGFIAGPAVGGALGGISLRLPFTIAAALTLVNVGYGALVLPESHPADRAQPIRWAILNPGGALLGLVRRPDLGLLAWQRLCADIARQITQVCWALHAAARFGWGTAEVGAAMAIAALVGLVSQVLLVDRGAVRLVGIGSCARPGAPVRRRVPRRRDGARSQGRPRFSRGRHMTMTVHQRVAVGVSVATYSRRLAHSDRYGSTDTRNPSWPTPRFPTGGEDDRTAGAQRRLPGPARGQGGVAGPARRHLPGCQAGAGGVRRTRRRGGRRGRRRVAQHQPLARRGAGAGGRPCRLRPGRLLVPRRLPGISAGGRRKAPERAYGR